MESQLIYMIFTAIFIGSGFFIRRGEEHGKNRRQSWFGIAAGLSMTFVGGAALLSTAGVAVQYGYWAFIDPLAVFLGLSIALVLFKDGKSRFTIGEALTSGSVNLRRIIGLCATAVYVLLAAAQVAALSRLFGDSFSPLVADLMVVTSVVGVAAYLARGGLSSVTRTDVLQFLVVLALFFAPACVGLIVHARDSAASFDSFAPMPAQLILLFCIPALFLPVSQDVQMRINAARSRKHAVAGVLLGATFYAMFLTAVIAIGMTAGNGTDPESIVPQFLAGLHPVIGITATSVLLAAVLSSLDSVTFAAAQAVQRDVFFKNTYDTELRCHGLYILVVAAAAFAIGRFAPSVLSLIVSALTVYISALLPMAIGKALGSRDRNLVIAVVVTATIWLVASCAGLKVPLTIISLPTVHILLIGILELVSRDRNATTRTISD